MEITKTRIREIIAECLGETEDFVKDDSTFNSLEMDSLDKIEIVMAIEEELGHGLIIPDSMVEKTDTVNELYDVLMELNVNLMD